MEKFYKKMENGGHFLKVIAQAPQDPQPILGTQLTYWSHLHVNKISDNKKRIQMLNK
jgi:hypothetical protein